MLVGGERYDLFYAEHYPLAQLHITRDANADRELEGFVRTLTAHIEAYGVRFPIGVVVRADRTQVRPGNCRVIAARRLGLETIPAIVCDYTRSAARFPDWERLPYDAQAIQARFFAGGDSQVELSRRFFSIKKRDTVRRPGVEDEFTRELRVAGVKGSTSGS